MQARSSGADRFSGVRSVSGAFIAAAKRRPKGCFIKHVSGLAISYAEAACRVSETLEQLVALDLGRGDCVICYMEDSIPLVVFNLAASALGVVPAPLTPLASLRYLKALADQANARHVLTTPELSQAVQVAGLIPVYYSTSSERRQAGCQLATMPEGRFDDAIGRLEEANERIAETDPFMIQPTSGSTGVPKLVLRPHAGFLRYARFVGDELAAEETPHRFLVVAALTHAFGLHMLTTAMSLAAELCIPNAIDTATSLEEVRRLDPTVLPMTPRVLRSFYQQHLRTVSEQPDAPMFGPSAQVLLSAGGKSDVELMSYVAMQGVDLIEFYGSSEASIIALTPRKQWREGFAGKVVRDADVRIQPDGEIAVHSPGLMLGYFGDPEQTAAVLDDDGFYRTGDFGEVLPDGFMRILGRKRDVFNTLEGSNIYPERIEIMLERAPEIAQVMLVGDARPRIAALVVVADAEAAGLGEADGFLPPENHRDRYGRVHDLIRQVNCDLEVYEQVRVFSLFAHPFPREVYTEVGAGKVRRGRKQFYERFAERIAELYGPSPVDELQQVQATESVQPIAGLPPPSPRFLIALPALFTLDGRTVDCRTRNVNMSGALIATSEVFPTGGLGTLRIVYRKQTGKTKVKIIHSGGHGTGVAFLDPDRQFLLFMGRLLDESMAQGSQLVDRRRAPRIEKRFEVVIESGQRVVNAMTSDVSQGGAFIRCAQSEVSEELIRVTVPSQDIERCQARVARRTDEGIGIVFDKTSDLGRLFG